MKCESWAFVNVCTRMWFGLGCFVWIFFFPVWCRWNWRNPPNGLIESIYFRGTFAANRFVVPTAFYGWWKWYLCFGALFEDANQWHGPWSLTQRRFVQFRKSKLNFEQSTLICLNVSNQWCVRVFIDILATSNGNDVFCHSIFSVVVACIGLESFFIWLFV